MIDFKTTSDLVKQILVDHPESRNSDDYLYCLVARYTMYGNSLSQIGCSADYFLAHRKTFGVPGYETVRRTRQKIQELHPELKAVATVQESRSEREKEFKAFALGDNYGRCEMDQDHN